jgi:hypothetical protein
MTGWLDPAENGIIENAQLGLLLLAAAVFLGAALRPARRRLASVVFYLSEACFCLTMAIRELDAPPDLGAPVAWWVGGPGRTIVVTALWLPLLVPFLMRWRETLLTYLRWVFSWPGLVMALACLLLATGWPLDRQLVTVEPETRMLVEELLELGAYLLVVVSAALSYRIGRHDVLRADGS